MLKRLSVVMLAMLAFACSADRVSIRVTTEGTVFDRTTPVGSTTALAEVPYDITNTGEKTVFLPACGSPVVIVERLNAGTWEQWSGSPICLAIYPMAPIEIRSGAHVSASMPIADAGRFRLKVDYGDNSSARYQLFAYSEPFDVR